MSGNCRENGSNHSICRLSGMLTEDFFKAFLAKIFVSQIDSFGDSIRVEHNQVPRVTRDGYLFVFRISK
jgi:hypothetical protein